MDSKFQFGLFLGHLLEKDGLKFPLSPSTQVNWHAFGFLGWYIPVNRASFGL